VVCVDVAAGWSPGTAGSASIHCGWVSHRVADEAAPVSHSSHGFCAHVVE
jgi:hypothetical protein